MSNHLLTQTSHAYNNSQQIGWRVPLVALSTYTAFFVIGSLIQYKPFNYIGFFVFTYIILVGNYNRMLTLKHDHTVKVALYMTAYLAFHFLVFFKTMDPLVFSKITMIFIFYALFYSYNYVPLPECSERRYFTLIACILILISLYVDHESISRHNMRIRGLYGVASNLALSVFVLLFYIDEERDSFSRRLAIHVSVFACLMLSATAGALLAYMVGLAFKLKTDIWKILRYKYIPHMALAAAISMLAFFAFDFPEKGVYVFSRISYQLIVIITNIENAIEGRQLNFYYFDNKYGMVVSSGIWRVTHWMKIIKLYWNSSVTNMLIGHGAGSVRMALGTVPHNDYLRVLYEFGAIGFGMFLFFFGAVYKQIKPAYRYVLIIPAFYSLSESNLDQMQFMIMFVAFIATVQINTIRHDADSKANHIKVP